MTVAQRIVRGLYRDSVALMQLAADLEKMEGVTKTGAMMATPNNLDLARDAGLLGGSNCARTVAGWLKTVRK